MIQQLLNPKLEHNLSLKSLLLNTLKNENMNFSLLLFDYNFIEYSNNKNYVEIQNKEYSREYKTIKRKTINKNYPSYRLDNSTLIKCRVIKRFSVFEQIKRLIKDNAHLRFNDNVLTLYTGIRELKIRS